MNELVTYRFPTTTAVAALPVVESVDAYGALLADSRCASTRKARAQDCEAFARYLRVPTPEKATSCLIAGSSGQANAVALGFYRWMMDAGLASSTVNRRLSTLRRLVKLARRLGLIDFALDIDSLKLVKYRDTTGPGHDGWLRMLATATEAASGDSAKARRDLVIVRLLHDAGLRRGEVAALDLADVDLDGMRVAIIGKGKSEKQWVTIGRSTVDAMTAWVAVRGLSKGPLFIRLDNGGHRRLDRLDADWIRKSARALGRRAGLSRNVSAHSLRHAGCTRALDITNGDVRTVRLWTRHAKLETVLVYDDNRQDGAGRITRMLSEDA